MSQRSKPLVRRAEDVTYESVDVRETTGSSPAAHQNAERSEDAADGLRKGVLVGPEHGAPNLAVRRFELEAGAEVPKHTNEIEHEQYVLEGEYVVGISEAPEATRANGDAVSAGEEHVVSAGDSLHIPAGVVHWYRNESDEPGAFLCAVPNGDDEIRLVE